MKPLRSFQFPLSRKHKRFPTKTKYPERHADGVTSDYLHWCFSPKHLRLLTKHTASAVRRFKADTIIVRGVSGMSVGFPASAASGVPIGVVRKDRDGSHSHQNYEGPRKIGRYVIVDDFVDTGATVGEIQARVKNKDPKAKCVAVLCFNREAGDQRGDQIGTRPCGPTRKRRVPDPVAGPPLWKETRPQTQAEMDAVHAANAWRIPAPWRELYGFKRPAAWVGAVDPGLSSGETQAFYRLIYLPGGMRKPWPVTYVNVT